MRFTIKKEALPSNLDIPLASDASLVGTLFLRFVFFTLGTSQIFIAKFSSLSKNFA